MKMGKTYSYVINVCPSTLIMENKERLMRKCMKEIVKVINIFRSKLKLCEISRAAMEIVYRMS